MTQLRQKMLEELQGRNYSHRTAKTYIRIVREFTTYFHQPPDKLGPIASAVLPYPYLSAYVTSKTALVRFSEILAAETRRGGVHVFAIGPGATRTAMSSTRSPRKRAGGGSRGSGASSQRSWTFRWSGPRGSSSTSRPGVPTRCQDCM